MNGKFPPMLLTDLEPQFLRNGSGVEKYVHTIAEADGIWLMCPKCLHEKGKREGVHGMMLWRPRVPISENRSGPGRWEFSGTGYHDLTLTARSSSIFLDGTCMAHFYIQGGQVTDA